MSHRTFLENNDNSLFEKWKRILKNPLGPRQHRAPGPREHRAPGPHTCLVHLRTSVSNVSPTLSMDLVFHGSRRPRWGRGCFHVRLTPSCVRCTCILLHLCPVRGHPLDRCPHLHTPFPTPNPHHPGMLGLQTLLLHPSLMWVLRIQTQVHTLGGKCSAYSCSPVSGV